MTGSKATYAQHSPVSIAAAAPGWRAVYLIDQRDDGPGWWADPVAAFVVCHVTRHPCAGSTARPSDEGNQIHAVIHADYLECADEISNYWKLLPPGAADPTADEIAAERPTTRRTA